MRRRAILVRSGGHPIIQRMTFSDTMTALDNVRHSTTMSSKFLVEAVAYQRAAIEEMERRPFAVTPMHPIKDKRARLRVAARYIKMGIVKFPSTGLLAALDTAFRPWKREAR